jgi:hypothetical protein
MPAILRVLMCVRLPLSVVILFSYEIKYSLELPVCSLVLPHRRILHPPQPVLILLSSAIRLSSRRHNFALVAACVWHITSLLRTAAFVLFAKQKGRPCVVCNHFYTVSRNLNFGVTPWLVQGVQKLYICDL